MAEFYKYTPCPGTVGNVFYSNVPVPAIGFDTVIKFTSLPLDIATKIGIGKCYEFERIIQENGTLFPQPYLSIDWNLPSVAYSTFQDCDQCALGLTEPCGGCPPGYTLISGECIKTVTTNAEYTGGLITVYPGTEAIVYSAKGVRLYGDISGYTYPIIGNGPSDAAYTVRDANGAGVNIPQLANVMSTLWGCSGSSCSTFNSGGKLNTVGIWNDAYTGTNLELCFEFCVNVTSTKQYIIGIGGDNNVKIYLNNVLTIELNGNDTVKTPYERWHAFPITLTAGDYTIKVCGRNDSSIAAFGAEIYDIDLATFQSTLLTPATTAPNCGNIATDTDPYLVFSTKDYIGSSIPDPANLGEWFCADGSDVIYCNGLPSCSFITVANLLPCVYQFVPCCGGHPILYEVTGDPLTEGATYYNTVDLQCYTAYLHDGSWTVTSMPLIDESLLTLIPDGCTDPQCLIPCNPCQCYRVRYTGVVDPLGPSTQSMDYLDCAFVSQTYDIPLDGSWGPKTCMKSYDLPAGDYEIVSFGDCILVDTTGDIYECPPCYVLTDCDGILDPIYTLSSALASYVQQNLVIQIEGSDACWIPTVSDTDCDCAVDVNIAYSFYNCPSCKNPKGYKLTECTTGEVIFTNQDLSIYVDKVVELDCGGCWLVEALDLPAPNTQPVTIVSVFDDCKICNGEYYLLEDCTGKVDSVITYTDLSAYVGKVIKLKYCPETCWTVAVSTSSANAGEVLVDVEFEDCPECYLTFPCVCNRVTNTSTETVEYTYYDCAGELQTVSVNAGQTSAKLCVLVWESAFEPNDCDCILVTTDFQTPGTINDYQATQTGNIINGQPEYGFTIQIGATTANVTISWTGSNWSVYLNGILQKIYLTVPDPDFPGCPIGPSGLPDGWFYANGSFSTQLCPPVPLPFPGTIETFGECIDGVCPRPVFPKRQVKPGYNSPTCTPDKYEKIVCNFSEWMYKDVLEQRYGISNCCPEELMKWEIKKEILDLEVMINPDYDCLPVTSCCDHTPNVPTGSCNSQ